VENGARVAAAEAGMIAFAIKTREFLTRPRVNSWTLNSR